MKVIICGAGGEHDADVESSFILGYESAGGIWNGTIIQRGDESISNSLVYAASNGFDCIVRSVQGVGEAIPITDLYYPGIQVFMPAGNNTHIQIYSGNVKNIVITGCGISSNLTGYNIEFFSIDPLSANNLSSYANGYIAGQIAKIKELVSCTWWEARYRARKTASANFVYTNENGYGKINIEQAIHYTMPARAIPDPYTTMSAPGNLTYSLKEQTGELTITIPAITNAYEYEIFKNGSYLTSTSSLSFVDTISRRLRSEGRNRYKYRGKRGNTLTDFSNEIAIPYHYYTKIKWKHSS